MFLTSDAAGTDVVWQGEIEDHKRLYNVVPLQFTFNLGSNAVKNYWTNRLGTRERFVVRPVDHDPQGEFPIFPQALSPENVERRVGGGLMWSTGQRGLYEPEQGREDNEEALWTDPLWTAINWVPVKCAMVHVANPFDASSTLDAITDSGLNVVLVDRNDAVTAGTQALRAQQAGADAVIIVNVCDKVSADTFDPPPGADGLSVTIPVYSMGNAQGNALVAAVRAGASPIKMDVERADGLFSSPSCLEEMAYGDGGAGVGSPAATATDFKRWNSNLPTGDPIPDVSSWSPDVTSAPEAPVDPTDDGGAADDDDVDQDSEVATDSTVGSTSKCACKPGTVCAPNIAGDNVCEVGAGSSCSDLLEVNATQVDGKWMSIVPCLAMNTGVATQNTWPFPMHEVGT